MSIETKITISDSVAQVTSYPLISCSDWHKQLGITVYNFSDPLVKYANSDCLKLSFLSIVGDYGQRSRAKGSTADILAIRFSLLFFEVY